MGMWDGRLLNGLQDGSLLGLLDGFLEGFQDGLQLRLLDWLLDGLQDEFLEGLLDGMLEGLRSWVAGGQGLLFYGKLNGFVMA